MTRGDAHRAPYSPATRAGVVTLRTVPCGFSTMTDLTHIQEPEERVGQFPPLDGTLPPLAAQRSFRSPPVWGMTGPASGLRTSSSWSIR